MAGSDVEEEEDDLIHSDQQSDHGEMDDRSKESEHHGSSNESLHFPFA